MFKVYHKEPLNLVVEFREASSVASRLEKYLSSESVCAQIRECHRLHATSHDIQAVITKEVERLGFRSEQRGLFKDYEVSALRPDFYLPVGETGVLLEVERGKTITNNMDLLDLWKCHICRQADFLFLIVPVERPSGSGTVIRAYDNVLRRLSTFFKPQNYVNVEAVFVFGY